MENRNNRPLLRARGTGVKLSRRSTSTILLYTGAIFFPLIAFSVVLLALLYWYKVGDEPSTGSEVPGGFYLVDFSATRLIFVSSWSSSVAPKLVSVVTGLYLFSSAKEFIRLSAVREGHRPRLPTPYQLALLVGLSTGSATELWKYAKYCVKRDRSDNVPILKRMGFVLVLFQGLGLLIFALDSLVHFTTDTISRTELTDTQQASLSFSQGLRQACLSGQASFDNPPCSYNRAGSGGGYLNGTEVAATVNGVSSSHHLLNITIPDSNAEDQDLIVLGPALNIIPPDMSFKAQSFGVATSCTPVTRACGIFAAYGASTPFHCSEALSGDLQIPEINTAADYWFTGNTDVVGYMAEFFDSNFSQPYKNYTVNNLLTTPLQASELPSTFYLATVMRTELFGLGTGPTLQQDPEVVVPIHGGVALALRCNVTTYEVEYTFYNGSIANAEISQANGTVTWLWNSVLGVSIEHLSQGFSVATSATSAKGVATLWSRFYSEQAVAILTSALEPRPNLQESSVQTKIVTKVPRGPLLALVGSNILFAVLGLFFGVLALARDSAQVSAVSRGLGIEGLVARIFEQDGGMIEGRKVADCFEEMSEGGTERVAVQKETAERWDLVRTGLSSSVETAK